MLRKNMLLGLAVLVVGMLLLAGCTGSTASKQDAIVGTWKLQGKAPKSADPTKANYTLPAGAKTETQQFLADGTYVTPDGQKRTWTRVDANTVEFAKVKAVVLIKGTDLYETVGTQTLHWTKSQ